MDQLGVTRLSTPPPWSVKGWRDGGGVVDSLAAREERPSAPEGGGESADDDHQPAQRPHRAGLAVVGEIDPLANYFRLALTGHRRQVLPWGGRIVPNCLADANGRQQCVCPTGGSFCCRRPLWKLTPCAIVYSFAFHNGDSGTWVGT